MKPIGYIYLTTCLVNNKIYIGKHELNGQKNYIGSGTLFKRAVNKYGNGNFKLKILRLCYSLHELRIWEHVYIVKYKSTDRNIGYNIAKGDVNTSEYNPAKIPEVREKIRKAHAGKKRQPRSEETKRKISESLKNRKMSEETKLKISSSMKGKNKHWLGKKMSKEARLNMSIAKKGKYCGASNPNYGNHKIAGENNPMFGKHFSEETKKHWSEIRKGRKLSEETKKKMSLAHKKRNESQSL